MASELEIMDDILDRLQANHEGALVGYNACRHHPEGNNAGYFKGKMVAIEETRRAVTEAFLGINQEGKEVDIGITDKQEVKDQFYQKAKADRRRTEAGL